jgi:hypothetical protein
MTPPPDSSHGSNEDWFELPVDTTPLIRRPATYTLDEAIAYCELLYPLVKDHEASAERSLQRKLGIPEFVWKD